MPIGHKHFDGLQWPVRPTMARGTRPPCDCARSAPEQAGDAASLCPGHACFSAARSDGSALPCISNASTSCCRGVSTTPRRAGAWHRAVPAAHGAARRRHPQTPCGRPPRAHRLRRSSHEAGGARLQHGSNDARVDLAGHDDQRESAGQRCLNPRMSLGAVHGGHQQVDQRKVEGLRLELRDQFMAVARLATSSPSSSPASTRASAADERVVVGDEHLHAVPRAGSGAAA